MDQNKMIKKIKKAALLDQQNREDVRYKRAMAFLTKKGFLKTNMIFADYYFARLRVKDFIWAGKNVEPRILEVLPAAVARLPRAFIMDTGMETLALQKTVQDLNLKKEIGHDFLNMPYNKVKVWMDIPLNDKRTKIFSEKKKLVTFRLSHEVISKIKVLASNARLSEADLIESLVHLKRSI